MKTIIIKNSILELSNNEVINLMLAITTSNSVVKKKFVDVNNSVMLKQSLYDEIINKFNRFSPEYKIEVMNCDGLSDLICSFHDSNSEDIKFEELIHYFNYSDLHTYCASNEYIESLRFVVAYNKENILGILKFAIYSGKPSISYCSVNKLYKSHGISKCLLDEFFKFYSLIYSDKTLTLSGYSVDGWKYLRKSILSMKEKYNISISERSIEYCGENGYSDDDYILINESKEEIKKLYGEEIY